MTFHYNAYGLYINSEFILPELSSLGQKDTLPKISIRYGEVNKHGIIGGKKMSPFIWATSDKFWLEVPNVARFLVSKGCEVVVDPFSNIDEASVRVFLLGSCFGALLFQRGFFLLHANAIEIGNNCLIAVGPSGIGKSTLASSFLKRGYRILADDVVPVSADNFAIPGFGRVKLWKDSAVKLGIETDELVSIRPNIEKFNLPLGKGFCPISRKIAKIYTLGSDHTNEITFIPLNGFKKFQLLRANTYRYRFMSGMEMKPLHLQQAGDLAKNVPMAKITRPKKGFKIEELVDSIISDISDIE
jgi:hypothetical protein